PGRPPVMLDEPVSGCEGTGFSQGRPRSGGCGLPACQRNAVTLVAAQPAEALAGADLGEIFEAHPAGPAMLLEQSEEFGVVHLTRVEFVASREGSHLNMADRGAVLFEILDDRALFRMDVIAVEHDLERVGAQPAHILR